MANQFSRLYDVERVGGDQRTRLAELLRSQGMNQPQGQMVSGWYVAPSWAQNLNAAAQMGLGTYMGSKIDEEKKAETARLLRELGQGVEVPQEQKQTVFNNLERIETEGQTPAGQMSAPNQIQQLAGRMPASTEQSMVNPALALREPQPKFRPLTEEEKVARAMELAQINPAMAQVWSAQDTARQNRLSRAEELADKRAQEERMIRLQLEGKRDIAQMIHAGRQGAGGEKWQYDAGSDTWVMPPNAQFPMGRSTPNISKVGALQNLNIIADKFTIGGKDEKGNEIRPLLETTPQGGWMGISGIAGTITDSQAGKAFDNAVEQLSTHLRKIHRIPGEGTLSDQEQRQYGLQLPKKTNSAELNASILQDLRTTSSNAVLPGGVNPLQMNVGAGTGVGYGAPPAGAVREKKR